MSKIFKIVGGLVVVIALAISAVFLMTSGLASRADDFFTKVKSGEYPAAYEMLSDDFKATTTQEQLQQFLQANALTTFKESTWNNRSISGSRGELIGSITTESGGVVPVSIAFVKGGDEWKIYGISKPKSGIQEESSSKNLPAESEQIQLVKDTMHLFAQSVSEQSMATLYAEISNFWKKQFSQQQMTETFQAFYQFGNALMVVDQQTPILSEKAVLNDSGFLVLKGYYATQPSQLKFTNKYIYEGVAWKLVGINVNIE